MAHLFGTLHDVEQYQKQIQELKSALAKSIEREQALEKDAERYRWLRDNPGFQIEYTGELTLDQHIDAARGGR